MVTPSTKNNTKLLRQLDSRFKWKINLSKYRPKVSRQADHQYFFYLVPQSFQGVNIFFVLLYENDTNRTVQTWHYFAKVEIKDYNVETDGRKFFNQPVKDDIRS